MQIDQTELLDAGYSGASADPRIERVRRISYLLDSCFVLPGTKFRFGVDPLLDLLPGVGDTVEAAVGIYLWAECASVGIPGSLKRRMAANLLLDWVIGIVPFAGSLFNAGFKAHRRNLRLLERYLVESGK